MTDLLIIGAGCAGLTAALYAAREGAAVTVLECASVGGQISFSPRVENYPGIKSVSGMEFSDSLLEQAQSFGANIDFAAAERVEKSGEGFAVYTDDGRVLKSKTLIIACGTKHRKLLIAREDDLAGNGVSYCATCDGAFYKNRPVAVVGGGSAALQSAMSLASMCSHVTLIHRRTEFRGEKTLAERLKNYPNIELALGARVVSLEGGAALTGAVIEDAAGSRSIAIDCLFVAVGQQPDNGRFANLVSLDENGYIIAGEDCACGEPGLFAAGDCRAKQVRQLTTAAADGAVAALGALKFIR